MENDETCDHFMQFMGSVKELYWEEGDILVQRQMETWVCDVCGETKYAFEENESELTENL